MIIHCQRPSVTWKGSVRLRHRDKSIYPKRSGQTPGRFCYSEVRTNGSVASLSRKKSSGFNSRYLRHEGSHTSLISVEKAIGGSLNRQNGQLCPRSPIALRLPLSCRSCAKQANLVRVKSDSSTRTGSALFRRRAAHNIDTQHPRLSG